MRPELATLAMVMVIVAQAATSQESD